MAVIMYLGMICGLITSALIASTPGKMSSTFCIISLFLEEFAQYLAGVCFHVRYLISCMNDLYSNTIITIFSGSGVCITIHVASHLFVMLILAPLLVRVLRVLIIFKFPNKIRVFIKYVPNFSIPVVC